VLAELPAFRSTTGARSARLRKTFGNLAEAKAWQAEAQVALRAGTLTAAPRVTLAAAAEAWVAGAQAGRIRNRSGDVHKPSAVRGYEQALRLRVLPVIGDSALGELRRSELQTFVDRLLEADHTASTIRNTLMPVRAI